jgi:DNA-binding IclR family transcriptional regulator
VPSAPVAMVDRIVVILKSFEGSNGSRLNLAEISALAGLPKSSTFRILQQLVAARLVERDGKDYRLGLGIFELGSLFPHRNMIVSQSKPFLQELSAGGRLVAHLAMLDGTEVVYLDKIGGRFAGQLPSRIGGRFTAHRTAVGKAILAHADIVSANRYFEKMFIAREDAEGLYRLHSEMTKIRQFGYSQEHDEAVSGISCVGASIMHGNQAIAAISICGPTEHINVARLQSNVRVAAITISRGLSRAPHSASA